MMDAEFDLGTLDELTLSVDKYFITGCTLYDENIVNNLYTYIMTTTAARKETLHYN